MMSRWQMTDGRWEWKRTVGGGQRAAGSSRWNAVTRFALFLCFLLAPGPWPPAPALAQGGFYQGIQRQQRQDSAMPEAVRNVGIDQRLNEQVPLDIQFRDETGRTVQLQEYFGAKPVVLSLVYYECPMLCNQVLNGLVGSLKGMSFDVGKQYEVVTISFDPRETPQLAATKKDSYIKRYGRAGAAEGWHFLTGDEESIKRITEAVGFRYAWDERTKQFAHASGIMVLTPQGRISRYLYGIEYAPKDVRLGLVEASQNKIGSPVDQLLLFCYHYDPATGKYGAVVMNFLKLFSVIFLIGLTALYWVMRRIVLDRRMKEVGGTT